MKKRKLLSQRHPILYFLAVWARRMRRYADWYLDGNKYAKKKIEGQFYRKNEIWRDKILKFKSGQIIESELITKNFARVTYTPNAYNEPKNQIHP